MAISIDWITSVISVPQSYLTLVSGTIYTFDTNQFRLDLKAIEASIEGMGFLKTHIHNTEVTVAGTTFARTVEILAPYSVEFEDGQYTVILEGSNNNVFDVANNILVQNQVQIISTNSAGLITVVSGSGVTPQDKLDIADRVWDEDVADHVTPATFGKEVAKVDDLGSISISGISIDADEISSAVWNKLLIDHTISGTYGAEVATAADLEVTNSKIDGIGSGTGAALNFIATDDNVDGVIAGAPVFTPLAPFIGIQTTGTYVSTYADDDNYHYFDDDTNEIDVIYQFEVGPGRSCVKVVFTGYLRGRNDDCVVKAYNFTTGDWDNRYTIDGQGTANDITVDVTLLSAHTGTGTYAGKVYLRFDSTGSNQRLYIDSLTAQAQNLGQTVGYSDGAIWIDTNASNTNTTPFVDGTGDNPVSTMVAANTLSTAVGLNKFIIVNGSSIEFIQAQENQLFKGNDWDLNLSDESISESTFYGANVTGSGLALNAPHFHDCKIGETTIPAGTFIECGIGNNDGQFTAGSSGEYVFIDCYSLVPGAGTPVFDFSGLGDTTGINIRRWSGGTNITLDSDCTMTVEVVTGGGQTITTGGGNAEIRGICRAVTITSSGSSITQISAVTGPVVVNGTGGTVRLYGVAGVVTDNSSGSVTIDNKAVSQDTINLQMDLSLTDYDVATGTEVTLSEDNILSTISGLNVDLQFISDLESGKHVLVANQLICYKPDNITELIRFNLYDAGGSPTTDDVYRRDRV